MWEWQNLDISAIQTGIFGQFPDFRLGVVEENLLK